MKEARAEFFSSLETNLRNAGAAVLSVEGDDTLRDFHLAQGTATVVLNPRSGGVEISWRTRDASAEDPCGIAQPSAAVRTRHSARKAAQQVAQAVVSLLPVEG